MHGATRWQARLSRVERKWHRVEDAAEPKWAEEPDPLIRAALEILLANSPRTPDPRLEACPIALVKEREHAVAIAALPLVYANIDEALSLLDAPSFTKQEVERLLSDARNALEGR